MTSLCARIYTTRGAFSLRVSLEAPPGVTVLFGPSGSGKTTTLSCIAGLCPIEQGAITLGDRTLDDPERGHFVPPHLRRIAYVFQSGALFPHMSVLANVVYATSTDLPRDARLDTARRALARMSAAHLEQRGPHTLSGGEAQRVALARAIARSPSLLLLDEPFAALDPSLRRDLRDELRSLVHDLAIPALLVSHDERDAEALGARTLTLEHGKLTA